MAQRPTDKAGIKKKPQKIKKLNIGEERFALQLLAHNIGCEREYVFASPRRFRFDFILLTRANRDISHKKIAIEIQGGIFMAKGGHNGVGRLKDMEKGNLAKGLGWTVYEYTPQQVKSGMAIKHLMEVL